MSRTPIYVREILLEVSRYVIDPPTGCTRIIGNLLLPEVPIKKVVLKETHSSRVEPELPETRERLFIFRMIYAFDHPGKLNAIAIWQPKPL